MKILYINQYAGSISMGMAFRPYYLSAEWEKEGNDVLIIGSSFSHLRMVNPTVQKDLEIQTIDKLKYMWIKTNPYKGNGIKRAKSIILFSLKLWFYSNRIVKFFKPDLVITSSTHPLDSYAGHKIAKKSKCKYIHEGHDIWPLTLIELGGMKKNNPFIILLSMAEKYAYKKSDFVVSLLPYSYEHMLKYGLKSKEKFFYIPNGIKIDDWSICIDIPFEHKKLLEELKKKNNFIVLYCGGHVLSNMLNILIQCAIKMKDDKSISFVLVGKGNKKEDLMKMAKDNDLNNVYFLDSISKKAIPTLLKYSDALYVGAAKSPLYRFGVSMNKVYDYMMAAKPIIYGVEAKNNEVLEANAGICFDPDDVRTLISAIQTIKNMSSENRITMGMNGKKWVIKNRDYCVLAKDFLNIVR